MNLNERIQSYENDMIESLRRLLKYNSVASEPKEGMPNGEEVRKCLDEALKMCEEMGFKTKNIDGYVGYAEYGEGEDYVAVLGHLDIVPVGNDWSFDPLGGEVSEGKIYGRGTNDDKGPVIAALYGLKAIKEQNEELGSKIRIIFGTSEETGGNDIEKYLEIEKQPKAGFTPDASFAVINAEKGIMGAVLKVKLNPDKIKITELSGGNAPNMVPDKAVIKYILDGKEEEIVERGISAHGSTPQEGKNAIIGLFNKIKGLNDEGLNKSIDFLLSILGREVNGVDLGIGFEDEASGKLTNNLGVMKFDKDSNTMELHLNIRVPVTFKEEDVKKGIEKTIEGKGIDVSYGTFTEPLYYPKDHQIVKTLLGVYNKIKNEDAKPLAIGGGTYAKEMQNILAFGPGMPGSEDVDHKVNEYIKIETLVECAKIYANAMKELTFYKGE